MKPSAILPLAAAALIAPAYSQAPAPEAYEVAPVLSAAALLPAGNLQGGSYRVRDRVPTDGYMAHFEIDSDFGIFNAVGVPQAEKRIVEIAAIRKLVETSKSDLFADGLRRSVEQPIDAVKNIITHPVDSVKQAPKTVGHFFGKVGASIGRGADRVAKAVSNPDDADAGQAARGVGNAAMNAAGFDKARLDTARQLGVDPYSDNPRLQEEMNKVTWAFFAGGLPLRIGAAVASAGVAVAATNMVGLPEDTYALTQSELALRDENSLKSMGVSREDIEAFQLNQSLSTTRRHLIVTSLAAMPSTEGRGHMIRLANACATAEQADFLVQALSILASRQRSGSASYAALQIVGRLPGATTTTGNMEVPAPVDFVTWTADVAGFAQRDDLGAKPKVLVHTGKFSPAASKGFAAAGWSLVAVPYPTR